MMFARLNFAMAGLLVSAGALLAANSAPAPAQKPVADALLQQLKADAQTIQSHAMQLEMLAKDPNSTWAQ